MKKIIITIALALTFITGAVALSYAIGGAVPAAQANCSSPGC